MVMAVDLAGAEVDPQTFAKRLRERGVELGSGVSVEEADAYQRAKKLIAFDLDSTLIGVEIIDELAKLRGVGGKVAEITERAMRGEMSFREALRARVALLKGLSVEEVEGLKRRLPITSGAQDVVAELKKAGFVTAIITGSFDIFAEEVGRGVGIDHVYANRLEVRGGKLTGRFSGSVVGARSKLRILKTIAQKEKISLEECVAIGDGANDLLLIKDAGLGVGFNPKKVVRDHADAIINVQDLHAVPALIGMGQIKGDVVKRIRSPQR